MSDSTALAILPTDGDLNSALDRARDEIRAVTTGLDAIRVREQFRAARAAASVLKRRDLAVEFAELFHRADRLVAKLHPAESQGRPKAGAESGAVGATSRKTHDRLSDPAFEQTVADARAAETPLTRQQLRNARDLPPKREQPAEPAVERLSAHEQQRLIDALRFLATEMRPPADVVRLWPEYRDEHLKENLERAALAVGALLRAWENRP